ncbi:AAA family ATPase, partial [Nanoarchaeota archaeon]
MILKSLKLENIRSYNSQKIDFTPGSTLLAGDIGAGKSTVLLATEFALFGALRGQLDASTLLRHGKNEGSIELNFQLEGKSIHVKRNLKRSKDSIKQIAGYIIVNDVKSDLMPVELRSRILELLGYPSELLSKSREMIFRYTVYTPQEQMKAILFEEKEQRLNTLRKVFGIDKYKRIIENTSTVTKNIRDKIKLHLQNIEDLPSRQKELDDKRNEHSELRKKIIPTIKELSELKTTFEDKKSQLENQENLLNEYNELLRKKESFELLLKEKQSQKQRTEKNSELIQNQIKSIKENISKFKIENPVRESEDDLLKNFDELQKVSAETKNKQLSLESQKKLFSEQLKSLMKQIELKTNDQENILEKKELLNDIKQKIHIKPTVIRDIDDFENKIRQYLSDLSKYQTIISEAEETKKRISQIDSCPLCRQDVTLDHKKEIKNAEDRKIDDFKARFSQIKEQKEALEKRLTRAKQVLEKLQLNENTLAKLTEELKNLENTSKELVDYQKQYAEIDVNLINLVNKLKESSFTEILEQKQKDLIEIKSK